MRIKNNWFRTNVKEILTDPIVRTYFEILDVDYEPITFKESCDATIREIGEEYKNIYLAYSGGIDSEFIFHLLLQNGIPFTPISVVSTGNEFEHKFVTHNCKKYNIEPIVISLTEHELFDHNREIFFSKNVSGPYSAIPKVLCGRAAKKINEDAVLLSGEDIFERGKLGFSEQEFYIDLLEENIDFISPLFYKNSTFFECWKLFNNFNDNISEFKSKIYDLPFRPKIDQKHFFSEQFVQWVKSIRVNNALKADMKNWQEIEFMEIKGLDDFWYMENL